MSSNRKFFRVRLCNNGELKLPIVKMSSGIRIALYDPYNMEHAEVVTSALNYHFHQLVMGCTPWAAIVVPATKPIPLAWYLARRWCLDLVVLKKERKPYHTKVREFHTKSITSDKENTLFITEDEYIKIKGKPVIFFDDVLSTGATFRASKKFLKTECKCPKLKAVFVFKEGDSFKENPDEVVYAGNLPFAELNKHLV